MSEKINIPVQVTGADAAQADLKQTGAAVKGVGTDAAAASQKQAAASQKAADANKAQADSVERNREASGRQENQQKKTNEQLVDFHRKGEMAVKSVLGRLNPELASMADLLFDVGEGFTLISKELLIFTAVAGGIAAVVDAIGSMTKRVEDATRALEAAREANRTEREKGAVERVAIEREANRSGLAGAAATIQRESLIMQHEEGIPEDIARNTILAEELARRDSIEFDRERFIRGIVSRGGKPAEFADKKPGDQDRIIRELMAVGAQPEAASRTRAFISQVAEGTKLTAPPMIETVTDPLSVPLSQIQKERPDLTADENKAIQRAAELIRDGLTPGVLLSRSNDLIGTKSGWFDGLLAYHRSGDQVSGDRDIPAGLGGGLTRGELVRLAMRAVREAIGERFPDDDIVARILGENKGAFQAAPTGPVPLEIKVESKVTNINMLQMIPQDGRDVPIPEMLVGGG